MRSRSSCALTAATATVVRAPSGVTSFISACPSSSPVRANSRLGNWVLAGNLTRDTSHTSPPAPPYLGSIKQPLASTDLGDAASGIRANHEDLGLQEQLLGAGIR